MLHRQPSSKDQARKSWEAILGLRYFGPPKSGERAADFVAFDCKKRRLTVTWSARCKRRQKQRQRGLKTAATVPENERCVVKSI
jgi:hypothetical protein